jgi:hypothetical protein
MFEIHRVGEVIEVRVVGEWTREDYLRACAEAVAMPSTSGVVFDLREMTNVPAPGRGAILAHEVPVLLPKRPVAFVVRPDTALYGVVRQITALTKGDIQCFDDLEPAIAWLMTAQRTAESER